jgi:ubiquinone/menaquinone biosynthesis C-methylase UbiE
MLSPRSGRLWPGRPRSAAGTHRRCDVRAGLPPERLILRNSRQWICSRATGRVLEVAVGTGLNLRHYPDDVALTAVDLDRDLLSIARSRAEVRHQVSLLQADAARLPFRAGSFDTVVCTLAMCEFRDRGAVLAEMDRVLRPQGRLLLLDHAQWRWIRHGRPATVAVDAGFVLYRQERLWFGLIQRLEARRPT